jgi:DNA polymerase I
VTALREMREIYLSGSMLDRLPYRYIIAADFEFEFGSRDGNRPRPVCMVARELRSGQTWRIGRREFGSQPPFPIGPDALFVAFYASAELGCFRVLGWDMPARILDLFCEFRVRTNGILPPGGRSSLVGALTYFSLDTIGAQEKSQTIDAILRGGPWSDAEKELFLDYCESDVDALVRLLLAMLPQIDLPRALLRGRYMAAASAMEHAGIPVDAPLLHRLVAQWEGIKRGLITAVDDDYGVFEDGVFKQSLFENYLARKGIPWARLESGALDLSDDTFREAAKAYPIIAPLRELRHTLAELRLNSLTVGDDGRNRTILSAFRAKTGRNQPSNAKYIFGPSVWIRGLIKPPPGMGLSYIDWSSQEIGIAAALSGDENLKNAYLAGDTYLAFGKQCGRLPPDATRETHGAERELLKQCVLGINYAMGERSLAFRIGQPEIVARDLLRAHRTTYPKFWSWSDAAVDIAMQGRTLWTVFGWPIRAGANPNPRSLRNFPMQANGAEMLRIACCLGTERGIEICGPIHDAVLICTPLDRLAHDTAVMRDAMAEASRAVLDGFELRTDAHPVRYPDRYMDSRGRVMWGTVMRLLEQAEAQPLKAAG